MYVVQPALVLTMCGDQVLDRGCSLDLGCERCWMLVITTVITLGIATVVALGIATIPSVITLGLATITPVIAPGLATITIAASTVTGFFLGLCT